MTLFRSCVCCVTFIVCLFCTIGHPVGDLSDVKRKWDAKDQWPPLRKPDILRSADRDGSAEHVVHLVHELNGRFVDGFENASVKQKVANIVNNIYVINAINGSIVNVGRESVGEKDTVDGADAAPTKPPAKRFNASKETTDGVGTLRDCTEKTVQPIAKKTRNLCNTTWRATEDNNTPVTCRCISRNSFRL